MAAGAAPAETLDVVAELVSMAPATDFSRHPDPSASVWLLVRAIKASRARGPGEASE